MQIVRGVLEVQLTFQIWCDCGILMEAYADGKYRCQGCSEVFDTSSVPVNKNNGQLSGKEVLDLLALLEDHHHEAGGPDDEPFCYVGCTCEHCWPDED